MPKDEALKTLSFCEFPKPLRQAEALDLWEKYRAKTMQLPTRAAVPPIGEKFSAVEQALVDEFMKAARRGPNTRYIDRVLKLDPLDIAIHQFLVITERATDYVAKMNTEESRARQCLGIGAQFKGQLPTKKTAAKLIVQLPHAEFLVQAIPNGFNFIERDRYISVVANGERLLLWGGYHRTYAVLSQMTPDGAGGAPLLTLMTGVSEVADFFSGRCVRPEVRDAILGERPPLFRDFFNPTLFMEVNLRKQRYEMHISQVAPIVAPGMLRCDPVWVDDES